MKLTFHGAAREVTGSMHLIEVNNQKVLLECGFYQGHRADTYTRNLNFPFNPAEIDAVVLSHAHIDHSGNLPNLVKQGFAGSIWCTAATRNLCTYMLMDSGHIQEQDALYLNKKKKRKNEPLVDPIYTKEVAQKSLEYFVSVGYHRPILVADGVKATFYTAGHILGSAFVVLDINEHATGKQFRLVFSGDVGRDAIAILPPPETVDSADILIMESTYGNRLHGTITQARKRLEEVVSQTAKRRGKVIIPSFAVGRTQELVYALNQLDAAGDIPELPIFVDSPLAVNATDVFRLHPEEWDADVQDFLNEERRRNPFDAPNVEYVRDVRRSKQLNFLHDPAVIISASGMAESGRILHHLKNNIGSAANTILIVSFQAEHTLGRRIKDGESPVRIFGEMMEVKAQVESIDGYSAHADQQELLDWADHFDRTRLQKFFLVHGEMEAATTLKGKLGEIGFVDVQIPERGHSFEF
ncbi:MAG: MBL fold metallo-hydrolase [Caldilineaceae bacterium]|nr:MBL fold metallo-hydrolase [Caldilineaceae bacterium]MBP9074983.1 MBL fold metallo-hydrolase [Caldilineaceae bacterium]